MALYSKEHKEPWEMTFIEFRDEYLDLLQRVAVKQEKGGLDSRALNYKDISDEEFEILKKDWKSFSRMRGYSEEDILEYERWLTISGRRDFKDASWLFHDILDKGFIFHIKNLYACLIEFAKDKGIKLNSEILKSYEKVKEDLEEVVPI